MPMSDVTAATGTFHDKSKLARDLAACMMRWEAVPDIPWVLISEAPDGGWGIDGHAFTKRRDRADGA